MSESEVVGIPVGGAVADQLRRAEPDTTQQPTHMAATVGRRKPTACRCGHADGGRPNPPATAGASRACDGAPRPADHITSLASGRHSSAPLRDAGSARLPQPAPIFRLVSDAGHSLPAPEPVGSESQVEVGVRGRVRALRAALPEARAADAKVRQPGRTLAFAAVAAFVVGSGFLVRALTLTDPAPPPVPPAWAGQTVGAVGHRAAPLGYARPTRVSIARVGINADLLAVGLAQDGAVGVPPAGEPLKAAWYDRGPAPGQAGPAVITGHVDSRFAPGNRAAFYELGDVRPGDDVDVARTDRRVAVFRVDSVALVPKSGFPTREVYGPLGYAALRLITCGGHYDRHSGYSDNIIVYAHLIGTR